MTKKALFVPTKQEMEAYRAEIKKRPSLTAAYAKTYLTPAGRLGLSDQAGRSVVNGRVLPCRT